MFARDVSMGRALSIAGAIVLVQAVALYLFGQPPICECGYVKLWENLVHSPGNSQHLFDWYTPSHIIHGLLFYALLRYLFPRMSVWTRLFLALGIEAAWEITENTPMVINHYRQQALAQGYTGDSVLNSVMDTLSAAAGFILAWRMPVWVAILLGLVLEIFVAYMIRDNLTLNILGFFHVFPFITQWQMGA